MKSLHIFADSERPDQYINSIVFCVLRRDVRNIEIIHIMGLGRPGEDSLQIEGISGRVHRDIQTQLNSLAQRGEYTFMEGSKKGQRFCLANHYGSEATARIQDLYQSCLSVPSLSYTNLDIRYDQLRAKLRDIARKGNSNYVDVTSIRKRYLGDIVAAALVEGLKNLYTFDIQRQKLDYERPWTMLFHELSRGSEDFFMYTNILDTAIYRDCSRIMVKSTRRSKMAATSTVVLLAAAFIVDYMIGPTSQIRQAMLATSGVASILSLVFVLMRPRGLL